MKRTCLLAVLMAIAIHAWGPAVADDSPAPTLQVDRTSLDNGGVIQVSGQAEPGKPVYLEVWADKQGRTSFFDAKKDDKTGRIPYKLYRTEDLTVMYRIYLPRDRQPLLDKFKAEGAGWSYAKALKDTGADVAYQVPANIGIDTYQTSVLASMAGMTGDKLPTLDDQEKRRRSMQLVKARFRSVDKLLLAQVDQQPDGHFMAKVTIPDGSPPARFMIVAATGKNERSATLTIDNKIVFPVMYFETAGSSINLFWPFLLTLAVTTFGVLMGAGGGFILNPLLLTLWPLPHTVVAGTVMPTVLFSQASGIYNYNKIKFISWKLGVAMGLASLAGGFIGPKLTELVTLDQFKFIFGWVLIILAGLMFWQTTPGYIARNKKEQAILAEFKRRAEAASQAGQQPQVQAGSAS
jgi:hypothetical protein